MTWHPALTGADPDAAWYSERQLEKQRRAEQAERAFQRMVERRDRFEAHVREVNPTTPEQREAAWQLAEEETD